MDHWRTKALALMEDVENKTCLRDWGEKENVQGTLALALRSLSEMLYPPTQQAIDAHVAEMKDRLRFRLQAMNEIKQNPQVLAIQIKAPVFIIGNPRTGSTLLHNLLSMDPLTRSPQLYEMRHPSTNVPKEARIADTAQYVQDCTDHSYLCSLMHPMQPQAADECAQVLGCDMFFLPLVLSSSFRKAFFAQPSSRMLDMYKFHKQMMQLFAFQSPQPHEHWTFKSPTHILYLKLIKEVYPDAKFIWLHRDPVSVISSFAAYWEAHCGWMFGEEAKKDKANRTKMHLGVYSNALNESCKKIANWEDCPQIVHCHYSDLKRDPAATIRQVYAELGRKFTPDFEARLQLRFAEMEGAQKRAPYSTSLEGTGLTRDDILSAYEYYLNNCPAFTSETSQT